MLGRVLACLLVLGGLAACNEDEPERTEAGSSSPAADDPRSEAERDADQHAADQIVLTLDDFEPGWESSPPDEASDTEEIDSRLAECLGIDVSELNPNDPTADSDDFTSSDDTEVSASVSFTQSEAKALKGMEIYRQDGATECLTEAVKETMRQAILNPQDGEEVPDNVEFGEVTLNELSVPDMGDESHGLRITIPMSADGFDVDAFLDLILVRIGRVGIEGSFVAVFSPFPTEQAADLVKIMVDRVQSDA